MKNRSLIYFSIATVLILSVLFAIAISPIFLPATASKFLELNEIRGSEIIYKGVPYTLNFQQQIAIIEIFNNAIIEKNIDKNLFIKNADFDFLKIYQFNNPDIIITPITYTDRNLIFSAPRLSKENLREVSNGKLMALISKTHDL